MKLLVSEYCDANFNVALVRGFDWFPESHGSARRRERHHVRRDPTTANNGGAYLGLLSGNNLSVAAPNPTAVLSDQVPLCHWAISNAGRLALSLVK